MTMGFFDFHEKVNKRGGTGEANPERPILTVSQLTGRIEKALKGEFPSSLIVQGEVSNLKHHSASGHYYFTLKDANACIDCVMFKSDAARLRFSPEDGMELLATGHVSVYAQRGRYQLYVTRLELVGQGALELAFRQLCAKLEGEGLFARERKKPIPAYPERVVLVTSRQTAALQDMLKVLGRFPWVRVLVYHVPVQGEGSAEKIAGALADLSSRAGELGGIDVILLGRGGGSLEDLWEFNEEVVARAIVASRIPVITGIGHEVDVSIADLAADYHAHTPTEAAQVAMSGWRIAKETVESLGLQLRRGMRALIEDARQRLLAIERHELFRRPLDRINAARQLLDDRQRVLALVVGARLRRLRSVLHPLASRLDQVHPRHRVVLGQERIGGLAARLSHGVVGVQQQFVRHLRALEAHLMAVGPEQVLRRGYSITTLKKTGEVVRALSQIKGGERLVTRLADGKIESTAEDPRQPGLFD